ncbi:hypothetical protein F4780DRAFT_782640 [Xylariomycetidae sp. FL0641]|nr:hypothetical protein F4780DRAFT_782640 [Xylariomycetidae sp. FL0641]
MSEGATGLQYVRVLVGPERLAFQIPFDFIAPICRKTGTEGGGVMELPQEEPEVFNSLAYLLFHNIGLPIGDFDQFFQASIQASLTCADYPTATLDWRPTFVSEKPPDCEVYEHICCMDKWKGWSADELRLRHYWACTAPSAIESLEPRTNALVKQEGDNTLPPGNPGNIPLCIPRNIANEADKNQRLLLKLIIFGLKYEWEELVNHTLDAFRQTEFSLRRSHPPPDFIEQAYKLEYQGNVLQEFMADYAFYSAKTKKLLSVYQSVCVNYPEFCTHLLQRLDEKQPVMGYYHGTVQALSLEERRGPLNPEMLLFKPENDRDNIGADYPGTFGTYSGNSTMPAVIVPG